MIIVKPDTMKTNNYKLFTTNRCPKCFSLKIDFEINSRNSSFGIIKLKGLNYKTVFSKTEKSTGTYNFDYINGPILKSTCRNFDNPLKNPQSSKVRISSSFENKKKICETTYNQLHCHSCGYYEFTENGSYIDTLKAI